MAGGRERAKSDRRRLTKMVRKCLSGVAFTPKPDPPRWSMAPWNKIVLVIPSSTGQTSSVRFTVKSIVSMLTNKYGLYVVIGIQKTAIDVALRFLSLRVFSRVDDSPLFVKIHSLVGEDDLAILEDAPSKMRRARVGYRWPKSFSDVVYHTTNDDLFTVSTKKSSSFLVYIDLLWRPDRVDILHSKMDILLSDFDSDTSD